MFSLVFLSSDGTHHSFCEQCYSNLGATATFSLAALFLLGLHTAAGLLGCLVDPFPKFLRMFVQHG